jgi:hypothetical protein
MERDLRLIPLNKLNKINKLNKLNKKYSPTLLTTQSIYVNITSSSANPNTNNNTTTPQITKFATYLPLKYLQQ